MNSKSGRVVCSHGWESKGSCQCYPSEHEVQKTKEVSDKNQSPAILLDQMPNIVNQCKLMPQWA